MRSVWRKCCGRVATIWAALLLAGPVAVGSAAEARLVRQGAGGRLEYQADERGNAIPDFSNCGYGGGGAAIPDVPVKVELSPVAGESDDTDRIQRAIDRVGAEAVVGGFPGAVLLRKGTYRVAGQLRMTVGGVVLRGEGEGEEGTTLVATGTQRRDLIRVGGKDGILAEKQRIEIVDEYVPVGSRSFAVRDAGGLKAGDTVVVRRAGNAAWIHAIGMDRIAGRPGNESSTKQWTAFELEFDRVVTGVEGNRVTVDAPITCAIEKKWGGGSVSKYEDGGRIEHVGVERLRAVSDYDRSKRAKGRDGEEYASDEDHASYLVKFDNVKNAWLRECTTVHFAHGPAAIEREAKWVTVRDCKALEPVSVITGGRRYPYLINGQLNLVQGCYSRDARHAFVFGSRVCGPNVFLDCVSERDHATSEPHHRWSVGGLYDNVKARIAIQDRQWMGSGHGWAGANYVVWNCEGTLVCQRPPTAQNWAIGFVGTKEKGAFERPDGYWESHGAHVEPRSLYLKQLEDRLGAAAARGAASSGTRESTR